jgi:hypothetical protein
MIPKWAGRAGQVLLFVGLAMTSGIAGAILAMVALPSVIPDLPLLFWLGFLLGAAFGMALSVIVIEGFWTTCERLRSRRSATLR